MLVPGLDTFQVDDAQAAEAIHLDTEAHVGHPVHGAGNDRNFERYGLTALARDLELRVRFAGVDRHLARYKRDFVEPVGHTGFSIAANPHSHSFGLELKWTEGRFHSARFSRLKN